MLKSMKMVLCLVFGAVVTMRLTLQKVRGHSLCLGDIVNKRKRIILVILSPFEYEIALCGAYALFNVFVNILYCSLSEE